MNPFASLFRLVLVLSLGSLAIATAAHAGDAADVAVAHIVSRSAALDVSDEDVAGLEVTDEFTSAHNGVTHVHLQQRLDGIAIVGATANVNVAADGSVMNVGNRLRGNARAAAAHSGPAVLAPVDALRSAAARLGLALAATPSFESDLAGADRAGTLSGSGVSQRPIPVRLVYQPVGEALRLAWNLQIDEPGGQHYWDINVDAETGAVLSQVDLVVHEAAPAGADAASVGPTLAKGSPLTNASGAPRTPDAYEVFAMPVESPNHGASSIVVSPAEPTASPFGWHDTDGLVGAEFLDTRGNNVFAQEDQNGNNQGGFRPSSASLDFLFSFDPLLDPASNVSASITNVFYWTNIVHDVYYQYGFDEVSGNFQVNNYGAGGAGGDQVNADALDGSGVDNANFLTLSDGTPPRMQMFRWTFPFTNELEVTAPGSIAGSYLATSAEFGPALDGVGLSSGLVVVDDGAGAPSDGCEPIQNAPDVSGQIALIDRGTCTFVDKVKNAQAAGAVAVVVMNNTAGSPIGMGGTAPTVMIPSVMISQADGAFIQTELPANPVFGTVRNAGATNPPDRDSDFDSGIIAHEFGHGISNRLTGGPNNVLCLSNQEQMGEGWSDFFGLAVTHQAGDTGEKRRGVGTYVIFEETDGNGIRPAPYSTDLVENPWTYADRGEVAVPHGVGFLWASMLWEMYWGLIDVHGYNPDVYADWSTGGNNLAIQLVMDGLKLQPCSPGFVNGRDAILQADQTLTGGANQCTIWEAFAKRGLGSSASQGSSNSVVDGAEAFDLPPSCGGVVALCDVETSQAAYSTGELLTVDTLRFANVSGDTLPARLRLQLSFGEVFTLNLIDAGAGGGLDLPNGFDRTFGPLNLMTIPASLPRGAWQFRCAIEDPTSSALLTEDVAPFDVQ